MMKKIIFFTLIGISFSFLPNKKEKEPVYDATYFDKTMVYMPMASFNIVGPFQDEDAGESKTKTVTVQSFYMHPYEVTNDLYKTFVSEIKLKDTALYKKILPDTLVWRDKLAYNEPYVEYYFRHPAYKNYPVVGISYGQCELFCDWLTKKYNSDPKRKHKKVNFKIPTRDQWYYSAVANTKPEKKKNSTTAGDFFKMFPWSGPYMQNKKGEWLANFNQIDQGSVMKANGTLKLNEKETTGNFYVGGTGPDLGTAGLATNYTDVTVPVDSYQPNDAGIYNLAGNVEEYIREKGFTKGGSWNDTGYYLRNVVEEKYDSTNYVSSARGFRFVMEVAE